MAKAKPKSRNNDLVPKVSAWVNTHRIISIAIIAVIIILGFIGHNKYLDYRNVNDMKTLLSDFQQLEKTIEAETGEEFTIVASCGSVGKFASSYACSIYLKNSEKHIYDYSKFIDGFKNDDSTCRTVTSTDAAALGAYSCSIEVRVDSEAEKIFYKYDTTPGQP